MQRTWPGRAAGSVLEYATPPVGWAFDGLDDIEDAHLGQISREGVAATGTGFGPVPTRKTSRVHLYGIVAGFSGLRYGEPRGLRVRHYDRLKATVTVRESIDKRIRRTAPKTDSSQRTPWSSPASRGG